MHLILIIIPLVSVTLFKRLHMVFKVVFSYEYNVVYVCTYHFEHFKEFRYIFLEDIGVIANSHR